ncbi:inorganic triphosphatase YgiF [Phyllobacterium myrsinacearum]|uniref:CYTH and CHAD domain-containing protein n=1 Tax=Phyllobacterium myrsinacearum TaxID=28101 RepID=UPI0010F3F37B|nr:CYTH and CHAD domain-containing protein [Phyllobacterium myrsinacearum]RZS79275.1 inorganic triphosphatase YgiF [Phyllobacterium myrsinacearum]
MAGASVQGTEDGSGTDAAAIALRAPVEIELKLRAPAGMLDDIRASAAVQQAARNKGLIRRLEATYYDTSDHRLFAAGLSLRVRREGRHHVQTVKRAAAHGSLQRNEWEAVVPDMAPDLALLPLAEIGAPLDGMTADELAPVFATRVRRHLLVLDHQDARIELALDDGVIEFGATRVPLSEVELELKQGKVAALYQFGLNLMDVAPLCLETQSKSARGYALALGDEPSAVKAAPSGFVRADTVDEAIAKLLTNCQQQIMANLGASQTGLEPEGVHQLRVALRRLRVALHFLGRELQAPSLESLNTEAKLFGQALGPARNWDVFLHSTLTEIEEAALPHVNISAFRAACMPAHDHAYQTVRRIIGDPRTNRFLLSLGLVIELRSWRNDIASEDLRILTEPLGQFAARVLDRVERQVRRRGHGFRHLHADARHRLRLGLKRLRYAAEFFLPLYSSRPVTAKYIKRLARLQDLLGEANDIKSAHELMDTLDHDSLGAEANRAVGAIIGWQGHRQAAGGKQLIGRWRAFKDTAPFWAPRL